MNSAPFSEPREWQECGECVYERGDFLALFRKRDEEALVSCPKCGQPPRREHRAAEDEALSQLEWSVEIAGRLGAKDDDRMGDYVAFK